MVADVRVHVRRLARSLTLAAAQSAPFALVVDWLDRLSVDRPNTLAVLTYHRVDWPATRPDLYSGLISATPEAFDGQLRILGARHPLVSLEDALEHVAGRHRLPPGAVMITFDDAYRDFAEHAWPSLKRHQAPATLFVPTGYPDQPRVFWWDRLAHALGTTDDLYVDTPLGTLALDGADHRAAAFRLLRKQVEVTQHDAAMALVDSVVSSLGAADPPSAVLGWEELRSLSQDGVTLAAHSRSHAMLDRVQPEELTTEIAGSLADLERHVGAAPAAFAYPSGQWNERTVLAVRHAGVVLAYTTERGVNHLHHADWLRLRRINVGGSTPARLVQAQLLPVWRRRRQSLSSRGGATR